MISGRGQGNLPEIIDDLLATLDVEVIPFDAEQAALARAAYSLYGKGQGHKAQLNFGDALVYALARSRREVLAFVGDDFSHTDLESVQLPREDF